MDVPDRINWFAMASPAVSLGSLLIKWIMDTLNIDVHLSISMLIVLLLIVPWALSIVTEPRAGIEPTTPFLSQSLLATSIWAQRGNRTPDLVLTKNTLYHWAFWADPWLRTTRSRTSKPILSKLARWYWDQERALPLSHRGTFSH